MISEKPQEALEFPFPYYAYAEKNLTVPSNSEAYLTLKFSTSIYWHNLMITALMQESSSYTNIQAIDNSTARITVWNYGSSKTGAVRVMALLPINATITLT